jgi:hypothetical protein
VHVTGEWTYQRRYNSHGGLVNILVVSLNGSHDFLFPVAC